MNGGGEWLTVGDRAEKPACRVRRIVGGQDGPDHRDSTWAAGAVEGAIQFARASLGDTAERIHRHPMRRLNRSRQLCGTGRGGIGGLRDGIENWAENGEVRPRIGGGGGFGRIVGRDSDKP